MRLSEGSRPQGIRFFPGRAFCFKGQVALTLFWSCLDLLGHLWTTGWRMAPESTPGYKPELDEPGLADCSAPGLAQMGHLESSST